MTSKLGETPQEIIELLSSISSMCVGELAMGYKLDAQAIGHSIYVATGLTQEELSKMEQDNG